jgi:type I restriction enzyme S subunit
MAVKKGYKQTEVGVIPEDWGVKQLKDIGEALIGLTYSPSNVSSDGILVLRSSNIQRGRLCFDDNVFVKSSVPDRIMVRSGDILICVRNGSRDLIGKSALINPSAYGMTFGAFMAVFRAENSRLLYHLFNSNSFVRQIREHLGATINQITNGSLNSFAVPLPPTLAEQEAIAGALSDADAWIESLEQLIAKKRQIKQGAMQELLNGKRRLPGFSGKWETVLLGEVITHCSSGATPYRGRPDYYKGSIRWITSGELNYNVIMDTIEHISDEALIKTNLKMHPPGTFLMAITGLEAAGTRGSCGIIGAPASTNQSCMAVYPNSRLTQKFLFHFYVYRGDELALKYCQGTKQQSYTASLVKLLPIDLPPTIQEQTAIATVLSDMDTEIDALESKLAKAREIKQGMMQELLTGKTRFV